MHNIIHISFALNDIVLFLPKMFENCYVDMIMLFEGIITVYSYLSHTIRVQMNKHIMKINVVALYQYDTGNYALRLLKL